MMICAGMKTSRRLQIGILLAVTMTTMVLFIKSISLTATPIFLKTPGLTPEPTTKYVESASFHKQDFVDIEVTQYEPSLNKNWGELKTVLYWNEAYGTTEWYGLGSAPFENCTIKSCHFTSNRSYVPIDKFDAILFHLRSFNLGELPNRRSQFQRYIMWTFEAPAYDGYDLTRMDRMDNIFNWTYSYRMDADIVERYGGIQQTKPIPEAYRSTYGNRTSSPYHNSSLNVAAGKTKVIAWFVSHCGAVNGRDDLVKQLQGHIPIDIYGKCGTLECIEETACNQMLNTDYKFYLAFENCNCEGYVTEKFFRALNINIVPIAYGGADYSAYAPPHSYIDIRDFKTAKDLADYLTLLNNNDDLYNEYFWWKDFYRVRENEEEKRQSVCSLCSRLHTDNSRKKYSNMHKWWKVGSNCWKPSEGGYSVWAD